MKKLVVSILMLSMLLMVFPFGITVSAEESFDEEEAMALYQGAEYLRCALLDNSTSLSINEKKPYFIVDLDDNVDFGDWHVFYKVISYYDRGVSYQVNTEDDLKQLIGKYYANDTINEFISFITTKDEDFDILYIDSEKSVYLENPGYTPFFYYDVIGSTPPQINGNKASANLILQSGGTPGIFEYYSVPASYIKTSAGWRFDSVVLDTLNKGWVDDPNGSYYRINIYEIDQPFNTPYLSQAQAEQLVREAYYRWTMIQEGLADYVIDEYWESNVDIDTSYAGRTFFEKKQDGSEYKYSSTPKQLDYVPVTDKTFDTIEKCYDFLELAFTDYWANLIMNKHYYPVNQELYAPIRLSNGGKLYSADGSSSEKWEDGVVMILNPFTSPFEDIQRVCDLGKVSVSGNKATIKVTLLIDKNYDTTSSRKTISLDERTWNSYEKTITFVYTKNGWSVSGGNMFDTLMKKINKTVDFFHTI